MKKRGTIFVNCGCKEHEQHCPSLGCRSVVLQIGRETSSYLLYTIEEIDVNNLNQEILEKARKKFQELLRNKNPHCELRMQEKWEEWRPWEVTGISFKKINQGMLLLIIMPQGELRLLPEEVEFNIRLIKDSSLKESLKNLREEKMRMSEGLNKEELRDVDNIIKFVEERLGDIEHWEKILHNN